MFLPEFLVASKFYVELSLDIVYGSDSKVDAVFQECLGLNLSQEIVDFCEVTPSAWGIKTDRDGNPDKKLISPNAKYGALVRTRMPGNTQSHNVILRRGMTKSMTLWNWFERVRQGDWARQRRQGSIGIYDQNGIQQFRIDFFGAWPVKYTIGDLGCNKTEVEIEELEIAWDGFNRVLPPHLVRSNSNLL